MDGRPFPGGTGSAPMWEQDVDSRELFIGSDPVYPFNGAIDDVRIYDRALSSSEVQQLYLYELTPSVALIKALRPSFRNLALTTNYQLQVSTDMNSWTNYGAAFTPTNETMLYPEYFDVGDWDRLFYRLKTVP